MVAEDSVVVVVDDDDDGDDAVEDEDVGYDLLLSTDASTTSTSRHLESRLIRDAHLRL